MVEAQLTTRGRARGSRGLLILFFLVAGIVGAVISYGFLTESLAALGINDPGFITTAGLPFLRSGGLMLAALSAGSFLFSAFLTPPKDAKTTDLREAVLDVDGTLAARTGAVSAALFGVIALLMVPMYLSDVSGEPLSKTILPHNWPVAVQSVSTSLAFLVVAVIAFVTAIGGALTNRWVFQPLLLVTAIGMIVPLGLEGHSAAGGDHDFGTNSYLWHLLFMVLWVGGLMALIQHGRRRGTHMDVAVKRYSKIALVSVIGMTLSGLINAAIRIHWGDWFTTGYGFIIVGKAVCAIVLGLFGFAHRQWTLPKIAADPTDHTLFRRVAAGEVIVMGACTGLAISLSRTPPPPPITADINTMDIELGYKLYEMPTIWNVWTMWRFDIVFGTLAIISAWAYLWAVFKLKKQGTTWPLFRTFWFMGGSLMLLVTMCSGIGMNMPALFSVHMIGHMILTMGVPVFWVLGSPFTLWLSALDPGKPGIPGMREWLDVFVHNTALKWQMKPGFNTPQFVILFYILYLTPLYDIAVTEHAGHLGMNVVFLWSGTLYYWELISDDPMPVKRSPMNRGAWLLFSMPFHLFFGITLIHMSTILAEDFYRNLGLPFAVNLASDQAVGGGIAWASGQFPLLIIFGAVFYEWWRDDKRIATAYDKRADEDGDLELEEYNRMLAQMSSGENVFDDYYNKDIRTDNKSESTSKGDENP